MHFTSGLASPLPFASVILKARKLAVSNAMKTAPHKVRGDGFSDWSVPDGEIRVHPDENAAH
jgi:hypothetical protein